MHQDPDSQIPGRQPPAQPAWQPPSLGEVAAAIDKTAERILQTDTPTPEQALALIDTESKARMAAAGERIATALEAGEISPLPPRHVVTAVTAIATVVAELEVKQRQVQDAPTGDPAFAGPRLLAPLAILNQEQTGRLLDAVQELGAWINEAVAQAVDR